MDIVVERAALHPSVGVVPPRDAWPSKRVDAGHANASPDADSGLAVRFVLAVGFIVTNVVGTLVVAVADAVAVAVAVAVDIIVVLVRAAAGPPLVEVVGGVVPADGGGRRVVGAAFIVSATDATGLRDDVRRERQ